MKALQFSHPKSTFTSYLGFLLLILFISSCNLQNDSQNRDPERQATEDMMKELTYTCVNIHMSGNTSLVEEVYSSEIIRHENGMPDIVGIDEYKRYIKYNHSLLVDKVYSVGDIMIIGDKVIYEMTLQFTHSVSFPLSTDLILPPTGNKIEFKTLNIDRIVDGKIVEEWSYWDNLSVVTQMGAIIGLAEEVQ